MDTSFLDSVVDSAKIDDGAWLHLRGPNGAKLYLDHKKAADEKREPVQPCRVLVRSTDSAEFGSYLDGVSRRAFKRAKQNSVGKTAQRIDQERLLAELKEDRGESFAAVTAAFDNIDFEKPGEARPPIEELRKFGMDRKRQWVVDQVLEFASDRANFTGEGAGPADDESD